MPLDHTEVLVVGAGPTGLTMAIELARRGVGVRIVDAAVGPSTDTRALGMQPRSLELYEKHGIVEELLSRGLRVSDFQVMSENQRIVHVRLGELDTPYPFLLMIPQNETQNVLTDHLAKLGVAVQRRVELIGLDQDGAGVTTELRHADGTVEKLRTPWLVGCDGAHSTVRHLLGLNFLGTAFEENFAVADLRMDWDLPHEMFFAFLNRGDFVAYFPMLHGWHRIAVAHRPGQVPEGDVTLDELQKAVERCGPPGAKIDEVRQAGRFRINQRRVERHSLGRVFLAGDAAHVHSVVGAQGMNTGIQDAFNLGWKLATVVSGQAGLGLLDSYPAERAPVAQRLVHGTRRITRMTLLRSPIPTAMRRNIAPLVLGRHRVWHTIARAISQTDVSYHDERAAAPEHRTAVGDRAPDVELSGPDGLRGARLYDLLDREKHTLLAFGVDRDRLSAALAGRGCAELMDIVSVTDSAVRARYGVGGAELILVRPDGYIGFRADGEDVDGLVRYIQKLTDKG